MLTRALARAALSLLAAISLGAQSPTRSRPAPAPATVVVPSVTDALHAPGQNVSVSLLTAGDGDQIWELFGHTAIWIHDNTTGRDTIFNWGVFDSRKPHFILHFLK